MAKGGCENCGGRTPRRRLCKQCARDERYGERIRLSLGEEGEGGEVRIQEAGHGAYTGIDVRSPAGTTDVYVHGYVGGEKVAEVGPIGARDLDAREAAVDDIQDVIDGEEDDS